MPNIIEHIEPLPIQPLKTHLVKKILGFRSILLRDPLNFKQLLVYIHHNKSDQYRYRVLFTFIPTLDGGRPYK